MCLILFSYDMHPDYRLILAANRDEYYIRPTKPLAIWRDFPDVFAGQDLKSMGT
ncbi:MAG: NRDE family protein, partial [Deltaproteobacteria bacterium]|nr:NRDE family protein [Deltaproteobacteria bacterium]